LEHVNLDADTLHYKQLVAHKYAELVYAGKWFNTLREALDDFMYKLCQYLTGSVKVVLYKGNIIIAGRQSPYALYSEDLASFGESTYDHKDATGFLKLYGLSTGAQALVRRNCEQKTN
jgi:argininosuccinate synthase